MNRRYPYREPHVLKGATPYGAAAALGHLAYAASYAANHAYTAGRCGPEGAPDVALAVVRMLASRVAQLSLELVAPYPTQVYHFPDRSPKSQHAADVALVRGWRRRFPGLLGR